MPTTTADRGSNVHLYPSPLVYESRMLRITNALAGWGLFNHIYLMGMADGMRPEVEPLDDNRTIRRLPIPFRNSRNLLWRLLRFVAWYVAVLRELRSYNVSCINCHSLSVLPLGVALKALTRAKLVYDTHELETETPNMVGLNRVLARLAEATFIGFADKVVVVGPMIAKWYEQRYPGIEPLVIRNLPEAPPDSARSNEFRERCSIPPDELIFFYQGALSVGRGIPIVLDAFSRAPSTCHVVFLGNGPMSSMVDAYMQRHSNIHMLPAVAPAELRRYTQSADVGLCVIEPNCLSYKYGFPNKLFDYLAAGLPTIVTDLPDLSKVIATSEGGWVISNDVDQLLGLIKRIDRPEVLRRGEQALEWSRRNSWRGECSSLHDMYAQLDLQHAAAG